MASSVVIKEDSKEKCLANRHLRGKNSSTGVRHGMISSFRIQDSRDGWNLKENGEGNYKTRAYLCIRDQNNIVPLKKLDGNARHGSITQDGGEAGLNMKEAFKKTALGPIIKENSANLHITHQVPLSPVSELSSSSDSKRVQIASSPSSYSSVSKMNFEERLHSRAVRKEAPQNLSASTQVRHPSSKSVRSFALVDSLSKSLEPPLSKFAVRVVDATNTNRPWVLTPRKPAKPMMKVTNLTSVNCGMPSRARKTKHCNHTVAKPSKVLEFQPTISSRAVHLPSGRSIVNGSKLKCQSVGSSSLKKDVPSASLRLPKRECKQYLPFVEHTVYCQKTHKLSSGKKKSLSFLISPSPISPFAVSAGVKAGNGISTLTKVEDSGNKYSATLPQSIKSSNQSSIHVFEGHVIRCSNKRNGNDTIEMKPSRNIVDKEMENFTLCVPVCGSSVWPVLKTSWFCGHEASFCCKTK